MTDEEALFAELEGVFEAVDEEGVTDLSQMSVQDLLELHAELEVLIKKKRQVIHPDTQEARDWHSQRNAIEVILHEKDVL